MMSGYDAATVLARHAGQLNQAASSLPTLFAFTDPIRTPDPFKLVRALPAGSGLIARSFGQADLVAQWPSLIDECHRQGVLCLLSAEPELAQDLGADGVHWPEKWLTRFNVRRSDGLITTSAHSVNAVRRAQKLSDAIFVSTVFSSTSPTATRAMGLFRAQAYAKRSQTPIYGLGGINTKTLPRLKGSGLAGVGAVEAILPGS